MIIPFPTLGNTNGDSVGVPVTEVDQAQTDLGPQFPSGASACLICIETIKKNEAVSGS